MQIKNILNCCKYVFGSIQFIQFISLSGIRIQSRLPSIMYLNLLFPRHTALPLAKFKSLLNTLQLVITWLIKDAGHFHTLFVMFGVYTQLRMYLSLRVYLLLLVGHVSSIHCVLGIDQRVHIL